jgi:hypothetical protein
VDGVDSADCQALIVVEGFQETADVVDQRGIAPARADPEGSGATVWVIGDRADLECYEIAKRRIATLEDSPHRKNAGRRGRHIR